MANISTMLSGNIVMSSLDMPNIADYVELHSQSVRNLAITIEVLDENLVPLDTIEGLSTGGSISISNNSLIRRTGNLSLTLVDYLLPNKRSLLWINNRIRVFAGIKNTRSSNQDYTHFCLGTYYITEPSFEVSADNRSITIELADNMNRWELEEIEDKIVIESETPLNTAVESLMRLYGEWNLKVDFTTLTIPYKLEFEAGTTVMSILETLRDLYMDWECFYDVDGTFVFRKINIQIPNGMPISWVFDDKTDHIISFTSNSTYKNVKNVVVAIGEMNSTTGITPKSTARLSNADSPFHENEIGVKKKVIVDSTLTNVIQCDSRARYELFKASNLQESASITSIPIYFLDGNNLVQLTNPATKEVETYVVQNIQIGLSISDTMSISASKVYYDTIEVDSDYAKAQEVYETVIDGIYNKGWLSLSESLIEKHYGLAGRGNGSLAITFEVGARYGVTAYTTGYVGVNRQTLTIDLSDFDSVGDSGDTGAGKGDYSDRILGHEVVHIVMNDVYGVEKTMAFPTWFKEGASEFIHGADERLKLSVIESGLFSSTKINALLKSAVDMMNNNTWDGGSDSYSASYLILKFLHSKLSSSKTMKNLMESIRLSESNGSLAVKSAIVDNTPYATFNEFVSAFQSQAYNYLINKVTLNIGVDENDTGSIAGIDHDGTKPLNAESIFDNSLATKGLALKNFNVTYNTL